MTGPGPSDPTVSMASIARYERAPDGRSVRREFPLTEAAATLEPALTQAQRDEATIENDWRTGQVAFSRSRGLVLVTLLRELAARVQPGFTCGPMRDGDELAELAASLAATLEAKRTYSHDYD